MNNYIKDSGIFFKEVSRGIKDKLSHNELIQLSFNLALGCERLLKGLLYDINPTYIYIEPDFKHSIQVIYKDKIISESLKSNDLAAKPNSDVITFSNSLLRAQVVSNAARNHKNTLFAISNHRDIIAHCELSLLDVQKMEEILKRDFYTMLKSFSDEHNIKPYHFFGGSNIKLSRISGLLQTDLKTKFDLLMEEHRGKWKSLGKTPGFVNEKNAITEEVFKTGNKFKIDCPSCGNVALLYYKPVQEFHKILDEMKEVTIGIQPKKLKCQYCKLEINDPALLDIAIGDENVEEEGLGLEDDK